MKKDDRFIVIGDIHGCYDELVELCKQLEAGIPIYTTGDLCDRGPNTKLVIDYIMKNGIMPVLGNHEKMWLDVIDSEMDFSVWLANGARATIESYQTGIERGYMEYELDEEHEKFLRSLPLFIEVGDYIISHAGFARGIPDSKVLNPDDWRYNCLWWRGPLEVIKGETQIIGHTPHKEVEYGEGYINIDTGCVFGNKLTAIELPSGKIYQVISKQDK